MKKYILIVAIIKILCLQISAQTTEKNTTLNFEGQIAVSTNTKAFYVNIGGPSLRINLQKFSVGINMYPSLKFEHETLKPVVTPLLGFGPQANFLKNKRLVLLFPCYYNATKSAWTFTAGLGYVLTKPKK